MGVRTFPALGFDPAPGAPAALLAQAREADRAARALSGAAAAAGRLSAGWRGEAADAYRARVAELPADLGRAAAAHAALARELAAYADGVAARQRRASDLEDRAADLRARAGGLAVVHHAALVGAAVGTAGGWPGDGGWPGGVADRASPPDRVAGRTGPSGGDEDPDGAAAATARAVAAELDAVITEAHRLLREHRADAAHAATRIRAAAADPPYRRPSPLQRLRDRVRGWIATHADALTGIARGLRLVSMVLGTASLVPGFQFLAPAAIALGTAAVAIDAGVVWATGRGSWSALALDAALTVAPAGRVARAIRSVPGVARGLKAVNRAIPASARGRLFRAVGNLPEGITADQLAAAAARIRSGARGLTGDVVVQGSRAGHSARAGSDIDFGLRVPPEQYDRLIGEFFGDRGSEARTNAVARGRIFSRHAGLKELRAALETDLDRKVDLAVIKRGGLFDNEPWLRVP
jgi:uncharacterized protein YukE